MTAPNSKASRRVVSAELRREALLLRRSGLTYDLIGQAMGFSRQRAYKLVKDELDRITAETAQDAEALRSLELERMDRALQAIWARIQNGDLDAIDRLLKISARRAALLGLDRPTKVAPTTPDGEGPYEGGGLAALLQQRQGQ